MSRTWPHTDVIRDVEVAPDGRSATARTALYLQGGRHHIHTTTILVALDQLMSTLLAPGERLPDIRELQHRNVANRNLVLTIASSAERIPRASRPALRGTLCTRDGRTFFVEGGVAEDPVVSRREPPGIFCELMTGMHLEPGNGDVHGTTLNPLPDVYARDTDPVRTRYAIVEFVLEGTRQRILERFGDVAGAALVVSGWNDVVWPRWTDVARGGVLAYRLSDGVLSSGVRLVHCDFSFPSHEGSGRVTIARIPAATMAALRDAAPPAAHVHARTRTPITR